MKVDRVFLLVLFMLMTIPVEVFSAKEKVAYPGGKHSLVRVMLVDKKGTPYRLSKPEKFLSSQSIERRKRQGISIDSTDLPITPAYLETIRKQGLEIVCMSKWNNASLTMI